MSGHIDIRTLSDYFLNRLTSEEETAVQEHPKAAAAVILICGIGIFTYDTVRNRSNVVEQHQIQNARDIENEVFAIDTFDTEDSLYYQEKYGDDFLHTR